MSSFLYSHCRINKILMLGALNNEDNLASSALFTINSKSIYIA